MSSVARRFSRAARTYERGAGLHRHVAARLIEMMPDPAKVGGGRILEVGCGTGVLTERLRERYPRSSLCVMDMAEGMVSSVRKRWGDVPGMDYVIADVRTCEFSRMVDLIVSSSALHWAIPLDHTLARLRKWISPGGVFCAALMIDGTLGELHDLRRKMIPGKTPTGRLPAEAEVLAAMQLAGFEGVSSEVESIQAHYRSADDFLRTIHAQGLTAGSVSRAPKPLNRMELTRLTTEYDLAFRDEKGGVLASFVVLYVTAVAPPVVHSHP